MQKQEDEPPETYASFARKSMQADLDDANGEIRRLQGLLRRAREHCREEKQRLEKQYQDARDRCEAEKESLRLERQEAERQRDEGRDILSQALDSMDAQRQQKQSESTNISKSILSLMQKNQSLKNELEDCRRNHKKLSDEIAKLKDVPGLVQGPSAHSAHPENTIRYWKGEYQSLHDDMALITESARRLIETLAPLSASWQDFHRAFAEFRSFVPMEESDTPATQSQAPYVPQDSSLPVEPRNPVRNNRPTSPTPGRAQVHEGERIGGSYNAREEDVNIYAGDNELHDTDTADNPPGISVPAESCCDNDLYCDCHRYPPQ